MATCFHAQENWNTGIEWVEASIKASKEEIRKESGVGSVDGFYKGWRQLLDVGLVVDNKNGIITLPYFKKKEHQYLSPRQIEERLNDLEKLIKGDDNGGEPQNRGDLHTGDIDPSLKRRENPSDILLKGLKKRRNRIEGMNEGPVDIVDLATAKKAPSLLDTVSKSLVLDLWHCYNPLIKKDDKTAMEYIPKFPAADVREAFYAAKKAKIKRGNFGWMIERLEKPEIYREGRNGKASRKKRQDFGYNGLIFRSF